MGLPPEPPDEQPPPPPPIGAEGGECPRCGTPYEPFQEYCLECGLRLPVSSGLIPVLSTAWRRRVAWYPGDWIWPVLGSLIVAALAAAIAILATTDNGSSTKTTAGTGPVPGNTGRSTAASRGDRHLDHGDGDDADRVRADDDRGSATASSALAGGDRVASGPERLDDRARVGPAELGPRGGGRVRPRKAIDAGLTDVGVLNSDEFSSLHPGYFVVFSGIYNSQTEAQGSARRRDRATYPQAYAAPDNSVSEWTQRSGPLASRISEWTQERAPASRGAGCRDSRRRLWSVPGAGATGSSPAREAACAGTACPCASSRGSAGRRRRRRRPRSAPR